MSGPRSEPAPGPDTALQKYSLELLTCLDEMRHKRDKLHRQILEDTREKERLQTDLRKLTDVLVKVNESLCDKTRSRCVLDQAISDTEYAFTNLAKGTENLLSFVKKVTQDIKPLIQEPEVLEPEPETRKRTSSRKSTR